jgi:AcrR family transcriptional regulator
MAALALCQEVGIGELTVELIAARSGRAKTTIYRRWPNVSALVIDATLDSITKAAPIVERRTARETFGEAMKKLVQLYASPYGQTFCTLIGRAQTDPQLRESVKTRWVEPRRKLARQILKRSMARGELRANLDVDVILDLMYGPIYHRLLVPYDHNVLTEELVEKILETVFHGAGL